MNDKLKTQWHAPFCAAVRLELRANKKDLNFENEHNLNTKPIQLDLLVIKKSAEVSIQNEIGHIFRGHNIFEYKSPQDALGVDEYFKTLAYACLYKANCPSTDSIKSEDITVSLVREGKPRELIKWFESKGCTVTEAYEGIYYITGEGVLFPAQVIVSSQLKESEHEWLRSLTSKMDEGIGERLIISAGSLSDKDDKDNADSVLQLAMHENADLFEKIKEVPKMCEALVTLMKPELDAAVNAAVDEAVDKAVTQAKNTIRSEYTQVLKRLKKGESPKALIKEGFSAETVEEATEVIKDLE